MWRRKLQDSDGAAVRNVHEHCWRSRKPIVAELGLARVSREVLSTHPWGSSPHRLQKFTNVHVLLYNNRGGKRRRIIRTLEQTPARTGGGNKKESDSRAEWGSGCREIVIGRWMSMMYNVMQPFISIREQLHQTLYTAYKTSTMTARVRTTRSSVIGFSNQLPAWSNMRGSAHMSRWYVD